MPLTEIIAWFKNWPWDLILKIGYVLYLLLAVAVSAEILMKARSGPKALAYLALIALLPVLGIIFYLSFGINYRKNKIYTRKILEDENLIKAAQRLLNKQFKVTSLEHKADLDYYLPLARMIQADAKNFFSGDNNAQLLINGETKFSQLITDLKGATDHIHIEYYIFENDKIGQEIVSILIQKHQQGVAVKFIYDDFGSSSIRKTLVKQLDAAGVPNYPFYKIKLIAFANRLNYRNHRKIVVIDNNIGYVGGINVADKYINDGRSPGYWRDTHLRIEGPSTISLQMVFLSDWQFCSDGEDLNIASYSPQLNKEEFSTGNSLVQIISSGPDSDYPSILFALNRAILLSKKSVWLTTPYFIPDETLKNALTMACLSGLDVRILVPKESDSKFVNTCASAHYEELMEVGVKIYRYTRGFIHAKTMVCDEKIAIIGTANLDQRSFDLNFEVNAIVYDQKLASELAHQFLLDLEDAELLDYATWIKRPLLRRLAERVLSLFSPLM